MSFKILVLAIVFFACLSDNGDACVDLDKAQGYGMELAIDFMSKCCHAKAKVGDKRDWKFVYQQVLPAILHEKFLTFPPPTIVSTFCLPCASHPI